MPLDFDGDDDAPAFGAPLPPEDRLWRHPSELSSRITDASSARPARLWGVAVVSGLLAAGLTVGLVAVTSGLGASPKDPAVVGQVAQPVNSLTSYRSDRGVLDAAQAASPGVVRLQVSTASASVVGSGVTYRSDGYMLTSAYLLDGAVSIRVLLADGTQLDGAVVGRDTLTDVGVVHVARSGLPVVTLGSSDALQVGEQAIAVSAADTGSTASVTVGVISGRSQRVMSAAGVMLHDMVETDAPLSGQASGGALTNSRGAVIGLIAADSNRSDGLGWATPIELAVPVAEEIVATGRASHAWLGVEGDDVSPSLAERLGISGGALVSSVAAGSPAAAAGLQAGDVITQLDGKSIDSMSALVIGLRGRRPGDPVAITYLRGTDVRSCRPTLVERAQP